MAVMNEVGSELLTDLVEFDRLRFVMREGGKEHPGGGPDLTSTDDFVRDGARCYEQMIEVLHEKRSISDYDNKATRRWLRFSKKSRKKLEKATGLVRKGRIALRDEDLEYVNSKKPWLSFTENSELKREAEEARRSAGDGDA